MTADEALRQGTKRLSSCSTTPRLDAEVLLTHVLGCNRSSLLAHPERVVEAADIAQFQALLGRRAQGEPVAYLTGHKEFYGLDLIVTPDVLVPRPETESVVDACLEALPEHEISHLADIGTGSGAIAVVVAMHRPALQVHATDISPAAIEVARKNCERHGLADRVSLYIGNLLEPLERKMNVIAANLPYVPPGEASPEVAAWEPQVAVFGGDEDGTAAIREFLGMAPDYLLPGGRVVMETAHSQGTLVARLAEVAFTGAAIEVRKDLAGYDRIVVVQT